jgi:hypothetical protein
MTTTTAQRTTAEWGVKFTWPDGHTEVNAESGRHLAEARVRAHNSRHDVPNRAEVVVRAVTVTDWEATS